MPITDHRSTSKTGAAQNGKKINGTWGVKIMKEIGAWILIFFVTYLLLFTDIAMAENMTYQEFVAAQEDAIIEKCIDVDAAGGYWSTTDERVCILTNLYAFKKVMVLLSTARDERDENRFKYIYDICELHNWSGWKEILSEIEKSPKV